MREKQEKREQIPRLHTAPTKTGGKTKARGTPPGMTGSLLILDKAYTATLHGVNLGKQRL
jgi:hypothetical protein